MTSIHLVINGVSSSYCITRMSPQVIPLRFAGCHSAFENHSGFKNRGCLGQYIASLYWASGIIVLRHTVLFLRASLEVFIQHGFPSLYNPLTYSFILSPYCSFIFHFYPDISTLWKGCFLPLCWSRLLAAIWSSPSLSLSLLPFI